MTDPQEPADISSDDEDANDPRDEYVGEGHDGAED